MARSSPHPDAGRRLAALLGTPLGRPYPGPPPGPAVPVPPPAAPPPPADPPPVVSAIPAPRRPSTHPPLPASFRPRMPRPAGLPPAPEEDPPTLPLLVQEGEDPPDPEPVEETDGPGYVPGSRPSRAARVAARWVPEAWRGARLNPGRAGAIALVLVAAVAAVVAAVGVWGARPRAEQMPALPTVSTTAPEPSTAASAAPTATPVELVVGVAGRVRRPGLVRVPDGSRVADVLEAAGGTLPGTDLATVNLARKVVDGEQVAIGVPAAADAQGSAGGAAGTPGSAPGGKVDLNRATVDQLDGLPGVGPVTAQRILDWRTAHGRFSRVDQLREVDGIGERRFAQLRELVAV
ncbi:hypothetical protein GCM10009836_29900 [Pseudonocardia ailaonensis]|uniref:Helix-hairpin-helix DNA-binding motif class 1 domain-containing protein n=1 Tax=Pseudonocardia ailaonensis TaxID=367279 RepID=A0ABN2N1C8_9PSEU